MTADALVVEFEVRAPAEQAFEVWTRRAGLWWPKGHTVSGDPDSVVFEPRVGGRIVERARDGVEHVWGEVTAWDAPRRVEFLWHLFVDRSQATRVALTFDDLGGSTRVRLEQTGFAALGEAGAARRERTQLSWGVVADAFTGAVADGPRFATIDVGTNSVKLHVAQREPDGRWRTLVDRADITRLGQGLAETGTISQEALERTADALAGMVDEAGSQGVLDLAAVGTAGLRMAGNAGELLAAVRARCGVDVEIISGDEESRLAYLAACAGLGVPDGSVVVFDTGGGSSQFTFGHGSDVEERFSVDVGAARYAERFGLGDVVGRDVVGSALAAIASDLSRLAGRAVPDVLVGMGGAVTNLVTVHLALERYAPDAVQGAVLDRSEVDRQIELYRTTPTAQRRTVVGLQPQRAEVILAGACVVSTVMRRLGKDRLTASDRSLRHGLLEDRFGLRSQR